MQKAFVIFSLAVGCSFAQNHVPSPLPSSLRVPANQNLIFQAHGSGDQIYTCTASAGRYSWELKAPDAQLLGSDGRVLGHHFAGPTWKATDGSSVAGKPIAARPSPEPGSIPWLLLDVVRHDGSGTMSRVFSVQRLNTNGGKAPTTGCEQSHAGAQTRVPYEAEYYFYGK
jgi:hypothetical protein